MNEKGRTSLASIAESYRSRFGSEKFSRESSPDSQATQRVSRKQKKASDLRITLFEEIRQHYRATRSKMCERLKFEQLKTSIRERLLRNISVKFKRVWRLVQNKTLMFSLVRNAIRTKRIFGMSPVVLSTMVPDKDSPEKRRVRLRLYPCDRLFQLHLCLLFGCFCYLIVVFPLNLAFEGVHASAHETEFAVLAYLCCDVVLRVFVVLEGVSVSHQKLSVRCSQYLRSYFLLDLLGSFPLEYCLATNLPTWNMLLFLPRLFRSINSMVNFQIYGKFFAAGFKKLHSSYKFLTVLLILLSTFVLVNISACFLIVISDMSPEQNWHLRYLQLTDRLLQVAGDFPGPRGQRKYLLGFYYSVLTITTVGYGDIIPTNTCTPE